MIGTLHWGKRTVTVVWEPDMSQGVITIKTPFDLKSTSYLLRESIIPLQHAIYRQLQKFGLPIISETIAVSNSSIKILKDENGLRTAVLTINTRMENTCRVYRLWDKWSSRKSTAYTTDEARKLMEKIV